MNYQTGYFCTVGKARGKVHVVENGKPICGSRVKDKSIFQWNAMGIRHEYIECQKCRHQSASLLLKEYKFLGDKIFKR
jgi:hypothetical protein